MAERRTPARAPEKGTQTGADQIGATPVGRTLASAVEEQHWMPDQHGFGHHGTESARPYQSGHGDDQRNEQDEKISHPGNGVSTSRTTAFRPFWQFAKDRPPAGIRRR
jgi:hypothetical protein